MHSYIIGTLQFHEVAAIWLFIGICIVLWIIAPHACPFCGGSMRQSRLNPRRWYCRCGGIKHGNHYFKEDGK